MSGGEAAHRRHSPLKVAMPGAALFLGVHVEIVDPGPAGLHDGGLAQVLHRRLGPEDLQVDLVFCPPHRHQLFFRIHEYGLSRRLAVVSQQEAALVDAIDVAFVGNALRLACYGQ